MRYDSGLHMACTIARKILQCLPQNADEHDNNDDLFLWFEELWGGNATPASLNMMNYAQG